MLGDLFDGSNGFLIERVVWIFRDETAVRLHLVHAEEFCEIGDLLERVDACGAGGAWDEADGGGAMHEVPDQRLRADDFDGGAGDVVLREQAFELRGERGGELADVGVEREEAGGQPEVVHAVDGFFGAFSG